MKINKEKVENLCKIINNEGAYILIVTNYAKVLLNRMFVVDKDTLIGYQFSSTSGIRISVLISVQEIDSHTMVVYYDDNTEQEPVTLLSQIADDNDEHCITKLKVGDKVKYIGIDHNIASWCFPEYGTIGTITQVFEDNYCVQWPAGSTSDDDNWVVSHDKVMPIQ